MKVHVMRDHPLLRAERCASSLVFSQYVTSHLCGVSAVCNTRGGSRRASEWVSECWVRDSILYVNVNIGMHLSESVSIMNPGNEAWVSQGNRRKRLVVLGDEGRSRDVTRRDWRRGNKRKWNTPAAQALSRVACWQQHFILFSIFWQSTLALHTGHNHKLTLQKCSGTFRNISRGRADKCEFQDFYHVVSLGERCASISSHSTVVAQQTS